MRKNKIVTHKVLKHASKGEFCYKTKNGKRQLFMKSGGHGQENIDFLNKKKIKNSQDTLFTNGVRFGSIEKHIKKINTKKDGHAWFPLWWTKNDISQAGKHVLGLDKNQNPQDNIVYKGRYKKVSVGVYCRKGKLKTIFPDFNINEGARVKAYVKRKNR